MKKIILIALVLGIMAISAGVFAQSSGREFVVQSVTGVVTQEVAAGKWEAVKEGAKLSPAAVVNTGLNSSLVLDMNGRSVTIKAMQKGTVENLANAAASAGTGIKLGAAITESKVNTDPAQGRTNISTASTRASDATEDVEWAEDQKKKD